MSRYSENFSHHGSSGPSLARALRYRSGGSDRRPSRTAARYPPAKMEYITAKAHPTPKTNPRKTPIIADQRVAMLSEVYAAIQ